jgi:hypothetical protein
VATHPVVSFLPRFYAIVGDTDRTIDDGAEVPMGVLCTFNNLRVHPRALGNFTVTLQVNGVDTALSCTVNGTADCTSITAVPVVAGDLVQFSATGTNLPPFSTFLRCQ